jgi:uncharacterized phage protein gp47/JayE
MSLFRPRNRVEILRDMIARVVARSTLAGLLRNSTIFHLLAAAADEDAEQYFQLAILRTLFNIDSATGSDLDERAAEITPATISRRKSGFASGFQTFVRQGTVGPLLVPAGTIVAAQDAQGQIKYRTQVAATILNGFDRISGVSVVALEAGARGNIEANTALQMVTRVPGVTSTFNPIKFNNGFDRESDDQFRARLKLHVQSLSRGTPIAVLAAVLGVQLSSGARLPFAKGVEPALPNGRFDVFVDDGTGTIGAAVDSTYFGLDDVLINPAVGGEINLYTSNRPIVEGTFSLKINAVLKTPGVDYVLNPAKGQVEIIPPLTMLSPGDNVTARYRNYSGLIQEAQRVIEGDPSSPLTYPGVRAAGTLGLVKPANAVFQTIIANTVVSDGFGTSSVIENVRAAISAYINGLDIGAPVIVAALIDVAMNVPGMINFQILNLSGSTPAVDQVMSPNQVARIISAGISLT